MSDVETAMLNAKITEGSEALQAQEWGTVITVITEILTNSDLLASLPTPTVQPLQCLLASAWSFTDDGAALENARTVFGQAGVGTAEEMSEALKQFDADEDLLSYLTVDVFEAEEPEEQDEHPALGESDWEDFFDDPELQAYLNERGET
ncbi:hypothetical protein ACIRS1_27515 [Kitasatospora sp. NPDC101176]|uniref:hypothetical protein n=1 Tax=Kitasatospora sp. NPDC101176 TaxID=3364099 RepID=UPI00382CFC47